jgi:hypothetical protein
MQIPGNIARIENQMNWRYAMDIAVICGGLSGVGFDAALNDAFPRPLRRFFEECGVFWTRMTEFLEGRLIDTWCMRRLDAKGMFVFDGPELRSYAASIIEAHERHKRSNTGETNEHRGGSILGALSSSL